MVTTFNRKGFTPEQCRALFVVEQVLTISMRQFMSVPEVEELCVLGSITFIQGKLTTKRLPREKYWLWNQSRAPSRTVDSTGSINLQFNKFNTRKSTTTPNGPQPPILKIWLFTLTYTYTGEVYSIIWCEKGFPPKKTLEPPVSLEQESKPDDLCLADLKFLRPFVSEDIAETFGWNQPVHAEHEEMWGRCEKGFVEPSWGEKLPTQDELLYEQFFNNIFSL